MRLLVAEDDQALGLFLKQGLEGDGHCVRVTTDGAAALAACREEPPDLAILDLNMPVMDGEQVLAELQRIEADVPVLVLTARQEVATRVRCLDGGANDLMLKPFSLHELRARVRALLRREREARLVVRAGEIEIRRIDHTAYRKGQPLELTNKEFALLEYLMLNRGRCVSRLELLDAVWKMEATAQTTNIVDVYVNYLRRKLNDPPPGTLIHTVRGRGYIASSALLPARAVPAPPHIAARVPRPAAPLPLLIRPIV